jgi:phage terminase Nu1 subunit (DNA packaging protein)
MAESEGATVTAAVGAALLMLASPTELFRLAREGWFRAQGPDRWRLVDLVQGYIRHLRAAATIVETKQLASLFGITATRVLQLSDEGWFKPVSRNRWDRDDAVRGYLKFLRADERRVSKSAGEYRLRDAKAREVEMRVAERARVLIPYDEAETALDVVVGTVRAELGGIAARVTRDLVLRRDIERAINDALDRTADRLEKARIALKAGDAPLEAEPDDDAGRMGRPQ